MSGKSQNLRRAKAQHTDLPEPRRSIVNAMPQVWEHDLWRGETYNASPVRLERLSKLRTKSLNDLSGAELESSRPGSDATKRTRLKSTAKGQKAAGAVEAFLESIRAARSLASVLSRPFFAP